MCQREQMTFEVRCPGKKNEPRIIILAPLWRSNIPNKVIKFQGETFSRRSHPQSREWTERSRSKGGCNELIHGLTPATRMVTSVVRVGWKRVRGCDYTAWKNEWENKT